MTNHIILPSRMVKPLLLHMFHRPSINADIIFWIYGEDNGSLADIDKYNAFSDILRQASAKVPLMNISKCFILKHPKVSSEYIGLSPLISMSVEVLDDVVKNNTKSDDRINIIADSHLWLALGLAYQSTGIINHAPRIISVIPFNNSTTMENLNFLYQHFAGNIRIDVINTGSCMDLLCAARLVEAIEPPEEPNGIFITNAPHNKYYITDKDLPTPVTGESIRVIRQIRHAISEASINKKFLKRTRTISYFTDSSMVKNLDSGLRFFETYLDSISDRFRCDCQAKDISKQLEKVEKVPEGLSASSYLNKALNHIISLSFEGIQSVAEGREAKQVLLSDLENDISDFSKCINPLIALTKTNDAFSKMSKELAPLRSLCLDVWQKILEDSIDLTVEEFVYSCQSDIWNSIAHLPEYNTVVSQKVIFRLTLPDTWIALTSPFTGFAVFASNNNSKVIELKNRSNDLKQFIYDYVMFVPGFSQEFKNYVSMSCDTEEISDNRPFFEKYPKLGSHIPIY